MKLTLDIPKQDNDVLIKKKRALKARYGNKISFDLTLLDPNYSIVDLSTFGLANNTFENDNYKLDIKVREGTLLLNRIFDGNVKILNSNNGLLEINLIDTKMDGPGVYLISVALLDKQNNDDVLLDNEIFLYLERNIRDSELSPQFPTVDEVRLSIRDSDPAENELLNWYDFSLSDICHAALRTVHQINAIPPPTALVYTISREIETDFWLDGITMFLFDMAAEHYRRNRLIYSAGGVNLDDKAKEENYIRAWRFKMELWTKKVQTRKVYWNLRKLYTVVSTRGAVRGVGFTP